MCQASSIHSNEPPLALHILCLTDGYQLLVLVLFSLEGELDKILSLLHCICLGGRDRCAWPARIRFDLKISCAKVISTLMVKHIYTLALRAMQANQQMAAHLTRVQSGFLPAKNIEQAQEMLNTMQEMLRDMQTALHAPPPSPTDRNYVPLK